MSLIFQEEIPLGSASITNQNYCPSGEAEKLPNVSIIEEEDDPLVPRMLEMETQF
jgi:hypothetical protein